MVMMQQTLEPEIVETERMVGDVVELVIPPSAEATQLFKFMYQLPDELEDEDTYCKYASIMHTRGCWDRGAVITMSVQPEALEKLLERLADMDEVQEIEEEPLVNVAFPSLPKRLNVLPSLNISKRVHLTLRESELARRNTKREYLLSGLLRCGRCGSRMGGHFHRGLAYYRCYKTRATNAAIDDNGNPQPCRCPEIRAASIEPVVWEAISQLVKDPDFLIQELRKRNRESSETRQVLERELSLSQERLQALPQEQKRLIEGYRKGLYPDFLMREVMERIQAEQVQLEKQKAELEKRLSLLTITESREEQISALVNRIGLGLDNLDFPQRQELLRLLAERICYNGESIEILTIIPVGEQLHPLHRGG